jgi:hypothetical protein
MDKLMYRYSLMRFNSLLLTLGVIRIGTLHDFRRLEHKKGICDPQEGKKVVTHYIEDLHISDSNDHAHQESKDFRALERFQIIKFGNAQDITIQNISVSQLFDHPDCFILCTSKYCSKQTMRQFEGAESCLEVIDINNFYRVLTETLNSIVSVEFRGVHEVKYQNREEPWNGQDWGRHPALIKEPVFKPQGELRAIWQPRFNKSIEPIIIGNYILGSFCRSISM